MKPVLATLFLLLALLASPLHAVTPAAIPLVVAESEDFEIVGRLEENAFIFFVDRHKTNAPVLAASLEVEQGDNQAIARFRPESGDYLIDDAVFLARFAQPATYPLGFTLIAGDESDLLSADFVVNSLLTVSNVDTQIFGRWRLQILLTALAGGMFWYFVKRRKGGAA